MEVAPVIDKCRIVGVLDDGVASLGTTALQHLRAAQLVIGGTRTLQLLAAHISPDAVQHDLSGALSQVPEWIRAAQAEGRRVVVLATGDPLCHGIAAYLASRLCIEAIEVMPNVSTLQLACARLGLPWQDMKFSSVHSKDAGDWVPGSPPNHGLYALLRDIRQHDRLAVLTSPDNTPDRIARMLIAEGLADEVEMAVAERLCQPEERIVSGMSLSAAAQMPFADPNVVLLWRTRLRAPQVLLGLPDASFEQRHPEKGLITKHEVRAVSLARLQLRADSVVWDIGAGSGAVGLEAARLCRNGHVYAIEKNADDAAIVQRNRLAMGISNHTLLHGKAPEGLQAWADPDAVFVGGSGGELAELIALILKRLQPQGWLVMNFVTIENLGVAVATLKEQRASWDVLQLQGSRSKPILHMHRMAAENPVWIVCAQTGGVA
ncbi:MAG: precorrin-6y C5,15-methyltransferase (decarboxylating) subunit CbiE [Hydrogenophaga sp.]|jgi:precorrin-6Y C5,15-methyltransferase (decarboxylating)|uniref:precorrin-6y C5,15-methyltransferase (decarboxylating) subunit CbiE n=1 Tax=Hydrogenophaga sp. TaxID=1904254 RepID=UPI001BBF649B|nr:precorrin-6y C5,15-methyltransferase (decarboxylating) subunit CbiE [Hydrogenophaga sp.]MBS3910851.1 precorrin-6y C5,15-methyltransferase (decarboxylating) subunit CbiE [Hydrogenophaga sp.]MDO9135501.1 precorrin-6y C5,15-methyltransferase (decarboxylating) subunit CbiE [Hydrogenophaga sp.]MDO9605543.1 precorrin-6y C5,15-methyltransferase (decarboxylating) subunit CbiE [Hydrogenophaga sp.]MDZ4126082.1 precorrin-6y C5,15-methyltransferase (decarboxylating) subunit CbiE [Hydrogenophaga sp.]MDZ